MVSSFNLDTRRDRIALTVDLNDCLDIIDLATFDAPDDLRAPALVSLAGIDTTTSEHDLGWRLANTLSHALSLDPGAKITLAVTREWLARRVTMLRAHNAPGTAAVVTIPFSTVLNLPRGPRASPRRAICINVIASASRPVAGSSGNPIKLDELLAAEADQIATFDIDLPDDLSFEMNRSMVLDVSCASIAPDDLTLQPASGLTTLAVIHRAKSLTGSAARFVIALAPGEDIGGHRLSLKLMLKREAMLSIIDVLLSRPDSQSANLLVTARLAGWGDGNSAPRSDMPDRRWVIPIPSLSIPVVSAAAAKVMVVVGDAAFTADLDNGDQTTVDGDPVTVEFDPESLNDVIRYPGLKVSILRWPLGRTGVVSISAQGHCADEVIDEAITVVKPGIDSENGTSRQAQAMLPLRAILQRLGRIVRSGAMSSSSETMVITITASTANRAFLSVRLPVTLVRSVHQMPICIDLGASAISIWAGAPRSLDRPFDMKPLPIGSWLAANVDPHHLEAGTQDADAALLIPSHISLDPMNHLRSDHAPHTLDNLSLVGFDRDTARMRMKHFGRRYDVSVPGPPPIARTRVSGRRISGLKNALASGARTLPVADNVNRYDAATDKASTTSMLEVVPLVADVLDELVDFYVMRLGQDDIQADVTNPAPVVPRVVVTCPSGIGDEVRQRYDEALGLFKHRLERLFPGSSSRSDTVCTLPEAVAAARYVADLLAAAGHADGNGAAAQAPIMLITMDLGASTSDVAVAGFRLQAGRVSDFETLATFGIAVGGDAIDAALKDIISLHADRFLSQHGLQWSATFDAPDIARALASQEPSCVAAERWVGSAILAAKARLATAVAQLAREGNGTYVWSANLQDAPTFDVVLAEHTPDAGWQGLCQPLDANPGSQVIALAPGVAVIHAANAAGNTQLILKLGRAAVMAESGAASQKLSQITHVLGTLLQRMARSAVPATSIRPKVMIVPTGRAALWPPLYESIAAEAANGRDSLPFTSPLPPATMKKAVVAGAALLIEQQKEKAGQTSYQCPLGLAVMGAHLAEQAGGTFRTGQVAERIVYLSYDLAGTDRSFSLDGEGIPSLAYRGDLGRTFQFVRTLPGLDPQGSMLAQLRPVLSHEDPMVPLEGDSVVDARSERIDRFGPCEIVSKTLSADIRRVTISAGESSWEGAWQIENNRVTRIY